MIGTPEEMAREIVRREGGWVDHKNDRGGATNYGISLRYAQGVGLDNDGDGDTDADDIKLVTKDQAVELYLKDFFYGPRINRMPEALHSIMFDMAVNAGSGGAVMVLQDMLGEFHDSAPKLFPDPGKADGVAGRKTFKALDAVMRRVDDLTLVNAYAEQRIIYYRNIVERRPSQAVFLKGWERRAREFMV